MTTTKDDILDWAETVQDLLYLVPREDRSAVLTEAAKMVGEENKRDPLKGVTLDEIPDCRDWRKTMPFKSRAVLAFAMDITKNNSTADADAILFADHGSVNLLDYIGDLPSLRTSEAA